MDLSDDEIEDYEQQLEETDTKAVLIDIASTNRQILNQLYLLNQTLDEPQSESESETYECKMCSESIQADNREKHIQKEHNAPHTVNIEDVFS